MFDTPSRYSTEVEPDAGFVPMARFLGIRAAVTTVLLLCNTSFEDGSPSAVDHNSLEFGTHFLQRLQHLKFAIELLNTTVSKQLRRFLNHLSINRVSETRTQPRLVNPFLRMGPISPTLTRVAPYPGNNRTILRSIRASFTFGGSVGWSIMILIAR
jgi:hypothetical protein